MAIILLHTKQVNFSRDVITVNKNLNGKIWIKWNSWPRRICLKHLKINILQIKPSFTKEVAEMSDVVNIPNYRWLDKHWRRTIELILNVKFSWLKQFI